MNKYDKKQKILPVLLSFSLSFLSTGCSDIQSPAAESISIQKNTVEENTVAMTENHISEVITDQLVVDAEIIIPENLEYVQYELTKKAVPKEDIGVFLKTEPIITDNPNYPGAYTAEAPDGSEFSTNEGYFRYARDLKKDDELVAMIESAYSAKSYKKEETRDLDFESADEAVQSGKDKIKELTGWDSEAIAVFSLEYQDLAALQNDLMQRDGYQKEVEMGITHEISVSETDNLYYIAYALTKDGLPIYNGLDEPGISMAVDLFWDSATNVTMLIDKDSIRYLYCRNGLFDVKPDTQTQALISAETALEKVKDIYSNTIISSKATISRIWLEYIPVPYTENPDLFRLSPYWCVQTDWLEEDGHVSSSAERINAVTGGNLSYGQ